jgi:Mlc titration factor MtfA (ptsG expression regulator)
MFERWREKRRLAREPMPAEWIGYIAATLSQWQYLDADERRQVLDDVRMLIGSKTWEAAKGFALTDEIKVTIAAQAALLILGFDDVNPYRNVSAIIVHPTTVFLGGEHPGHVAGTMSDEPMSLLGLAQFDGPIIIAWDEVRRNARHPERGHNVVFHEFAHKLDMLDGIIDGMPPVGRGEAVERWVAVCEEEFANVQAGYGGPLIDDYAATDPAEFFAVVTEVFFDRPVELEAEKTALYEVLRDFYRQDPAARVRAALH